MSKSDSEWNEGYANLKKICLGKSGCKRPGSLCELQ